MRTSLIHSSLLSTSVEFITEWDFLAETITLPFRSGYNYNCVVDWGDDSSLSEITAYNDADATHIYALGGTYQIKITGLCETFYINGGALRLKLKKIIQWGNVGFLSFQNSFYWCSNLTSLPDEPIKGAKECTSFSICFELTGLTSIPSGLFDNCPLVNTFDSCFRNIDSLTSIPSGLFDNCPLVTTFNSCFNNCDSLTSIPSGLFDNCPLVTTFISTFNKCSSLTSIPSGLFDNNINVNSYSNCFRSCTFLVAIPIELFDFCTSVTIFTYCFKSCIALTGNVPELWLLDPEPTGTECFYDCVGVDNYGDIPADWK